MNHVLPALRFKFFMTLLLGLLYPLAMTGIGKLFFPRATQGSLVEKDGRVVGSLWIGQKFERPEYFWARPSAVDQNPLPSGGSNLGPASADLKKIVEERRAKWKLAHGDGQEPPQDLLFASASGLDPEISPAGAQAQAARVAKARGMDIHRVEALILGATRDRQWGFLGEPRVNVLELNLALDREPAHEENSKTSPEGG